MMPARKATVIGLSEAARAAGPEARLAAPAIAATARVARSLVFIFLSCLSSTLFGQGTTFLIDIDGHDDDQADDDELVEGVDAQDHEPGPEDDGDERPHHGAQDRGHAAEKAGAADHRRRDGLEI